MEEIERVKWGTERGLRKQCPERCTEMTAGVIVSCPALKVLHYSLMQSCQSSGTTRKLQGMCVVCVCILVQRASMIM